MMKTSKFLFALSLISFQSIAAFSVDLTDPEHLAMAEMYPSYDVYFSLNFEDNEGRMSAVSLSSDNNDPAIFTAAILSGITGHQALFIAFPNDRCANGEALEKEQMIIKTNEQNVFYDGYCEGIYSYVTPSNKRGRDFLVNEFKRKDSVVFSFPEVTISFDATGFTKAWNSFGGDAL